MPFGSLPTHDSLWRSAEQTSHSIVSRLAVINLLHEARGLDTFAISMEKFRKVNDERSMQILTKNCQEEIGHVAFGVKWFKYIYFRDRSEGGIEGTEAGDGYISLFQEEVKKYYKGNLKGPFNIEARNAAGLLEEWYMSLCEIETLPS